jgi:hypothetical protein
MTPKQLWDRVRRRWKQLVALVGTVAVLLSQIEKIRATASKAGALWLEFSIRWGTRQFAVALVVLAGTVALLAGVWWREVTPGVRRAWGSSRRKVTVKGGASVLLLCAVAGAVSAFLLHDVPRTQVRRLLAEADAVGAVAVRTYANNASAHYELRTEPDGLGPRSFARITFNPNGSGTGQNCGFIVIFVRGTNLSRFAELRFLVRGQRGDEKIGVKAKDAKGNEVALSLHDPRHLNAGKITPTWQEAVLPLERFGNVDFALFENFSLFVNGEMAGPGPQTIDVGAFSFRARADAAK